MVDLGLASWWKESSWVLCLASVSALNQQGVAAWMVGTSLYHNSGEDMIFLGQMASGPS